LGIWVQLYVELCIQTGTCSPVSWCSSFSSYTYTHEHTLGYPGAALFQEINSHRNLLLGILDQLFFKLYLHTGTYSWVSWCSSSSSYTYIQEPTLVYPGATQFQAINSHRNLLSGILVQLYFMLYLHTEANSLVSWCSSLSRYTFTQEPSLGYPGAALFQALPTQRNLLSGILVQLSFKLHIHTGTNSWVSWCSSISSYRYTQEPTLGYPDAAQFKAIHRQRNLLLGILVQLFFLGYKFTQEPTLGDPGAAIFQAIPTHRNLLLGILVQLYLKLCIHTGTYSLVSWSCYKFTQEPTRRYPCAAFFHAIHTHRNVLFVIRVQLSFNLYIHTGAYS
jgi:hypothetical protein